MNFLTYILTLLASLGTYCAGESSPAEEGSGFLDSDDDEGTGEEDTGEDDLDNEDDDDDEDSLDDVDDDVDDDEDDDEDGESGDDPESTGEGAEEGGAQVLSRALREATRARLTAAGATREQEAGITVHIPTTEELMALPEFEGIHEDDMSTIHKIAAAIVSKSISSYNESAVAPLRTSASESARKNRIVASLRDFSEKYPTGLETHQDAMSEVWDEFVAEFGREAADEIPFEDLYIMAGGKGKAKATAKAKGVAQQLAKDQKAAE